MRFLLVTNLYPPQELGGYGRSMADFAWALMQHGHQVSVLTSNASYLCSEADVKLTVGPSGEPVDRRLQLKGSYKGGVKILIDQAKCIAIDNSNWLVISEALCRNWDGVLVGNVDLLGPEVLEMLLRQSKPVLHHIGFMNPPFPPQYMPKNSRYVVVASSYAVRDSLVASGFPVAEAPVVYPGARTHLFGDLVRPMSTSLRLAKSLQERGYKVGSKSNPLKIGFAGLLMATKGAHTLVEAIPFLCRDCIYVQLSFAGSEFQPGYQSLLEKSLDSNATNSFVQFVGPLGRKALSRFWDLQHVAVFSSIHPEAFGIVAAEAMAAGVTLVSTGVGGAAELVPSARSGSLYNPGEPISLSSVIQSYVEFPDKLFSSAVEGQKLVRSQFDVIISARRLERIFLKCIDLFC